MSLDYIFSGSQDLISSVQNQGYDLDSLCFMCKDLFVLFEDLGLQSSNISELIKNLKVVHDAKSGKLHTEENTEVPLKITVTNTLTHKVSTFRLVSSQGVDPLFTCDICKKSVLKSEVKSHVLDHESS
jgi:hypothetical protein